MLAAAMAGPSEVVPDGVEGIDWSMIVLPPCVNAVRDGADTPTRRARVTRAYYAPEATAPHERDRVLRCAAGQVVVVAPEGSILATWQMRDQLTCTSLLPRWCASLLPGPADHAGLVAALAAEGVRVEPMTRHLRVFAPAGPVYLPLPPVESRTVRHCVALLRRFGCTLRHDH